MFQSGVVHELRANYLLSEQFQNYPIYYTKIDYSFPNIDSDLTLCLRPLLKVPILN